MLLGHEIEISILYNCFIITCNQNPKRAESQKNGRRNSTREPSSERVTDLVHCFLEFNVIIEKKGRRNEN